MHFVRDSEVTQYQSLALKTHDPRMIGVDTLKGLADADRQLFVRKFAWITVFKNFYH